MLSGTGILFYDSLGVLRFGCRGLIDHNTTTTRFEIGWVSLMNFKFSVEEEVVVVVSAGIK